MQLKERFAQTQFIARQMLYTMIGKGSTDPSEIGAILERYQLDKATDGFWVWNIQTNDEWYSPKFRAVLGFNDEYDFPNDPESWQKAIIPEHLKLAMDQVGEYLKNPIQNPYYLKVTYRRKNGSLINILCDGDIVRYNNETREPIIMVGTHSVIN